MRTEDGRIIYQCLNGEPGAFGILVDKYKAGIYAFAYDNLGNFQDAQDVTQEVFERAYRNLRSLRRWESFDFWLYRIALNQCKRWFQARSRRPDGEFMEDQDPKVLEEFSLDTYRDSQVDESLCEALDSLSGTYREVLILHYFSGMTSNEMARALGTSPGAIRVRLSRARAELREEMVAMMDTAFEGQRLQASFTFRIVEAVKRIKIQPMQRMTRVPWSLSLATGIILAVMGLNPHLSILNPASIPTSSTLPGEMKALKTGEIQVDILKTAQIPALAGKQGNGDDGVPCPQKASLMAPQAGGGTWTKKADMPTARSFLSTCEVNGRIYATGGLIGIDVHTAALEEYDPVTDTWIRKADMPTQRNSMGAAVVNGKIYVIGGVNADTWLSTVEEYDPVKDKWTKKADMAAARLGLSASVVNGKIYAIGGNTFGNVIIQTVEEYDPVNDTWTRKANMPTRRVRPSTSVVNGRIYAIGGGNVQHGDAMDYHGLSVVEEYDPATDTWTEKSDMPTPRWGLSTSVLDDKIYAIGGGDRQVPFNVVEVYDPATDTWAKKPDMPMARGALSTSVVNGKIYVIGGSKSLETLFLTLVEEYDPESASAVKKTMN